MQLVQEKKGKVIVKIVKTLEYSDANEKEIKIKIKKAASDRLDIEFVYVDNIPHTRRGKHRFLIQKLPIEFVKYKK